MLREAPPVGSLVLRLGGHSSSRFTPGAIYTIMKHQDGYACFMGDNGELHTIYDSYYHAYDLYGYDNSLTNTDFKFLLKEDE
jgi:hypothetical protein